MHDERYNLTTLGLSSVQPTSVTLAPNKSTHQSESQLQPRTVPVDAIVLATGYSPSKWFHAIRLVGANGRDLHEEFSARGGPQMYRSTAIDGFPNFFVIGGPNCFTTTSSHLQILENCVNHALPLVQKLATGALETVEVKRTAVDNWTSEVQAALKGKVWETGGCTNWVKDGSEWNSVGYPSVHIPKHKPNLL
jgi:cation diffusion facilitator CzcD-associated flavoprotein CzcO